jgi:hypothetical protein
MDKRVFRQTVHEVKEEHITSWLGPTVVWVGALNFFGSLMVVFFWLFGDIVFPEKLARVGLIASVLFVGFNTLLSIFVFTCSIRLQIHNKDWRGTLFAISSFLCFGGNATALAILAIALSVFLRAERVAAKLEEQDRQRMAANERMAEEQRLILETEERRSALERRSQAAKSAQKAKEDKARRDHELELAREETKRKQLLAEEDAKAQEAQARIDRAERARLAEEKRVRDTAAKEEADKEAAVKLADRREKEAATKLRAAYKARSENQPVAAMTRFRNVYRDYPETKAGKEAARVLNIQPKDGP